MDKLCTFVILLSYCQPCELWFFDRVLDHENVLRCPHNIPRDNNLFAYKDTCIQLIRDEHSWYDARRYCTQHHGDLVLIQDMAKQQFIMHALKTSGWIKNGIWIGDTDREKEGHWKWVNDFTQITPRSTTVMPKTITISVETRPSTTISPSRSSTILSKTTPPQTTISTKPKPTNTLRNSPATTIDPTSADLTTLSTMTHVSSTLSTTHEMITREMKTSSMTPHGKTTKTSTTPATATQKSAIILPTTNFTKIPAKTTKMSTASTSFRATTPFPTTYVSTTITTNTISTTLSRTKSTLSATANQHAPSSTISNLSRRTTKAGLTVSPTPIPSLRPPKSWLTTSPRPTPTMIPTKATPTTDKVTRENTNRTTLPVLNTHTHNNKGGK